MSSPQDGFDGQSGTSSVASAGQSYIDSLIFDTRWGTATSPVALTYSFYANSATPAAFWATPSYSDKSEQSTVSALNDVQKAAAKDAVAAWAHVANISFTEMQSETTGSVGDIRFAWTSRIDGASAAWAYYPNNFYARGGDVWLSQPVMGGYPTSDWQAGGRGYETLIHEVGHALGLKHPFDGTTTLATNQDTQQYSVMSYTPSAHDLFMRVASDASGYSYSTQHIQPDTPMLYDIAAMQYLYGANTSYASGDNRYTFDPATPFIRTIWDGGGTDEISVANFTKACTIDLRAGHYSKITIESDPLPTGVVWTTPPPTATYDGTDNLAIAYGAVIENATGGSGADTLIANDAVNRLDGGAGIDTAVFDHARSSVARTSTGYTVSGTEGLDTLVNVERVRFSDNAKIALDLADGQAANGTARLIGAGLGPRNITENLHPDWVGIGLNYFDSGMSTAQVAALVASVMGAGNEAFVSAVYTNVIGHAPSADELQTYVGMLTSGTSQGDLLLLAANTQFNADGIRLSTLQDSGLLYA